MGLSDASDSAGDLAPLSDDERSCLAEIPGAPRPPRDIASLDWARYGLDVAAVRAGLERPRDGIVFTPPSMAHLLAWRLRVALERAAIVPKRVLDPALGTGSLLLALGAQLGWPANVQLVGVERDAAICAEARRQLPVSVEVRCGDSLGDPEADGFFDAVIGNPPFLAEKGNKAVFRALSEQPRWRDRLTGKGDLQYLFIHHALDVLVPGGAFALITTAYWPTASSARRLRADLRNRALLDELVSLGPLRVFKGCSFHTLLLVGRKRLEGGPPEPIDAPTRVLRLESQGTLRDLVRALDGQSPHVAQNRWSAPRRALEEPWHLDLSEEDQRVLSLLDAQWVALGAQLEDRQGVVSGADRDGDGHGIFFLTSPERDALERRGLPTRFLLPLVRGATVEVFGHSPEIDERTSYLLYLRGDEEPAEISVAIEHLRPFEERLRRRREVELGRRPWWALQWPRSQELTGCPKLICPRRSDQARFALEPGTMGVSSDCTFLLPCAGQRADLKAAHLLLNSSALDWQLQKRGKRKGQMLELYAEPLRRLRLPAQFDATGIDVMASPKEVDRQVLAVLDVPREVRRVFEAWWAKRWG